MSPPCASVLMIWVSGKEGGMPCAGGRSSALALGGQILCRPLVCSTTQMALRTMGLQIQGARGYGIGPAAITLSAILLATDAGSTAQTHRALTNQAFCRCCRWPATCFPMHG